MPDIFSLSRAGVREGSPLASLQRRPRPEVASREASGRQVGVKGYLQSALLLIFLSSCASDLLAAPRSRRSPTPPPPIDFSGVWDLDEKMSRNVSSQMRHAVLSVAQEGNRIWISPIQTAEGPRQAILSEEIVVDGRPYEKALGPAGRGLVTADWAKDRKSLWIEVQAGPPENPKEAVQRSVWKLSEDRSVWLRESVSISKGQARSALLVLRRRKS